MTQMKNDLPEKGNGGKETLDKDIYRVIKAHRDRFLVRAEDSK